MADADVAEKPVDKNASAKDASGDESQAKEKRDSPTEGNSGDKPSAAENKPEPAPPEKTSDVSSSSKVNGGDNSVSDKKSVTAPPPVAVLAGQPVKRVVVPTKEVKISEI